MAVAVEVEGGDADAVDRRRARASAFAVPGRLPARSTGVPRAPVRARRRCPSRGRARRGRPRQARRLRRRSASRPRGARERPPRSTSSSVTRSIAPPPCSSGSLSLSRRRVAHQRAGSERRVELVARERQEVDARAGHVDAAVGGELRGVDEQLSAVSMGKLGQLGDRPHLPADVRGAGDGDQVDPRPRAPKRPLTRLQQLVRRAGERRAAGDRGAAREACWSDARPRSRAPACPRRSAADRTLIASVVLRTKTTASPARAPTNSATGVARVLERGGGDAGTSGRCRGARCCTTGRTPRRHPTRRPSRACWPRSRGSRSAARDRRYTARRCRRRGDETAPLQDPGREGRSASQPASTPRYGRPVAPRYVDPPKSLR